MASSRPGRSDLGDVRAAPVLDGCRQSVGLQGVPYPVAFDLRLLTSRSVLEVVLLGTLFSAFVCSAMAARYYHHTGFIMSLPVGSADRARREPMAVAYVQRAGVLYSWSLRCFFFLAPVVVGLLAPLMMPPAALLLVALLRFFDDAPV